MNVKEFVDAYNLVNDEEKEDFVSKHILDIYLPYEEKIALCDFVIKMSTSADGDYKRNSPVQYVLFVMSVIEKYTNLENVVDDVFESFNLLDKYNLVDVLIKAINPTEMNKLQTVLGMSNEDMNINKYSIVAYFDDVFSKMAESLKDVDFQSIIDNAVQQ